MSTSSFYCKTFTDVSSYEWKYMKKKINIDFSTSKIKRCIVESCRFYSIALKKTSAWFYCYTNTCYTHTSLFWNRKKFTFVTLTTRNFFFTRNYKHRLRRHQKKYGLYLNFEFFLRGHLPDVPYLSLYMWQFFLWSYHSVNR